MAFKPEANQRYYLIAKHSQLPIGVTDSTLGQKLVQKKFDHTDTHQQFRLDSGGHFSWILLPPFKNRYIAVNNSSMDDKASIIQWEWEAPKHNHRFILEYAGNGYYRIKAMHSNKYWDVYEMKTTVGAEVVQHSRSSTDNQLFKLVPVVDNAVGDNPMSYTQVSDMFRTGALGLIGLIPDYGDGLKFLVGMFWSERDHMADLWNQMKLYVDERIRQFLKAQELDNLKTLLEGELKLLYDISVIDKQYKGNDFLDVIASIREKEGYFLERSKEILPYLLGMGTIMISLRKMIITDHATLFEKPLPAKEIEGYTRLLKETIISYTKSIEKSRKELIEWRMSHIPDVHTEIKHNDGEYSTAKDTYTNWSAQWKFGYELEKGDKDHLAHATNAVAQRRKQVRAQYTAELEAFLNPARQWLYLSPGVQPPVPQLIKKEVGSFGGPYSHHPFSAPADDMIMYINMYFTENGALCGLEVVYSAGSSGLKGVAGPRPKQIKLESKEYITNVYGYTRNYVEALWITTNKGRSIGGGNTNNKSLYFSGDLADGLEARLTGISGSYNGNCIEHLTFHWTYIEK